MKYAVRIIEGKGTPFVHLTQEAREELDIIYGGDIPYETFSLLATIFPEQSKERPVDKEGIGHLETVLKFRQISKSSMRIVFNSRARFYQDLADKA